MTELRPDIAAASSAMRNKLGGGTEIKKLEQYVAEDETVQRMAVGKYSRRMGVIALTDRRVLLLQHGPMSRASDSFPLRQITDVAWKGGLITGVITVTVGGNRTTISQVNSRDGEALVTAARARLAAL